MLERTQRKTIQSPNLSQLMTVKEDKTLKIKINNVNDINSIWAKT